MTHQRYYNRRILQRFMDEDELRSFHSAYVYASNRPVHHDLTTYQLAVIQRFMSAFKFKQFYQKYQEAKMPTTQNLHYGKDMEALVRRIVREEMALQRGGDIDDQK